jgi:hypothetical protein
MFPEQPQKETLGQSQSQIKRKGVAASVVAIIEKL